MKKSAVQPQPSSQSQSPDALPILYGEVCNAWRQLMDVRFKLLALVPAVSIFVVANLFTSEVTTEIEPSGTVIKVIEKQSLSPIIQAGIALAGLIITAALYVYERRNSELFYDLINLGRKIEKELGIGKLSIARGVFLGSLRPSKKWLLFIPIQHNWGINGIYLTTIVGWFITFLWKTLVALGVIPDTL